MKHSLRLMMLLIVALFSAAATSVPKPNMILVFIDDMGWADLSSYGNPYVRTNNIDSMADEGIRFERFYVNSPICSPSRVAITTGQYPQRWSITSYLANRNSNKKRGMRNWLDLTAPTIAKLLRSQGYATGHFGKWHMGGQRDVGDAPLITEYGFDESITNFEGLGPRILPLLNAFDGTEPKKHALGSEKLGRGPIFWQTRSSVTANFTDAAIEFIKQAKEVGKPFYVNLWPDDVHGPYFPPAQRRGSNKLEKYYGVLKTMDEQLNKLFDYVRSDKTLRNNTLIMISSDNGPAKGAGSAGQFRGLKTMLYEGGIRAPLIVWGPGLVDVDAVGTADRSTLLAAFDLVPSLLSLASMPADTIASQNFAGRIKLDALLGKAPAQREGAIYFRRPPDRDSFYGVKDLPDLALINEQWKLLCEYDGSNPELYDLANDPGENNNLAPKHEKVVAALRKELLAWHNTMPPDNGATYQSP